MERFVGQPVHFNTKLSCIRQGVEAGDMSIEELAALGKRCSRGIEVICWRDPRT